MAATFATAWRLRNVSMWLDARWWSGDEAEVTAQEDDPVRLIIDDPGNPPPVRYHDERAGFLTNASGAESPARDSPVMTE